MKKKSLLQHRSSKASVLQHSAFFMVQLSHPYMTTGKTTERKKVKLLSHVRLFASPWTVACQAPPSMGFSTDEVCSLSPEHVFPAYSMIFPASWFCPCSFPSWDALSSFLQLAKSLLLFRIHFRALSPTGSLLFGFPGWACASCCTQYLYLIF